MIQDFLASRRGPVYIYLIAWVVLFLWYWIFTNKADPTGFNDIAFKIVLPVFTFAASIPVGLTNDDGFDAQCAALGVSRVVRQGISITKSK